MGLFLYLNLFKRFFTRRLKFFQEFRLYIIKNGSFILKSSLWIGVVNIDTLPSLSIEMANFVVCFLKLSCVLFYFDELTACLVCCVFVVVHVADKQCV